MLQAGGQSNMNLLGTVYTQTIAKRSQEWESGLITKVYCHVGGACYCSGVQPKLTVVGEMNPDHTRLFFSLPQYCINWMLMIQ